METFYQVLGLIAAAIIIWVLYINLKSRPEVFSRVNIIKSFSTMGFLGLILIGFVALLVLILRQT